MSRAAIATKQLRKRLMFVLVSSIGLVLAGAMTGAMLYSTSSIRQQYRQSFQSEINNVYFYFRQDTLDHTWLSQMEQSGGLLIFIQNPRQALFWDSHKPAKRSLAGQAVQTAKELYYFDVERAPSSSIHPDQALFEMEAYGNIYHVAVARLPLEGERWVQLVILKNAASEQAVLWKVGATYAGVSLLALGCMGAVGWSFTGWAIRPVEESRRRQGEFVAAASHEFRSPLAVMQAAAGAIRTSPPEQSGYFAAKIESECLRLARLTDDLLDIAGADGGKLRVVIKPTPPQTLLLVTSERFEDIAAEKGIALDVILPHDQLPLALCDEHRILQLLAVLMDNALSVTPQGGQIQLSAYKGRRGVCLSVWDSGSGIPDSEKERIFQRFYRGDHARTDKAHYGLGLPVAQTIAHLHKGRLEVRNGPGGGAQFVLTLPWAKHSHKEF